MEDFRSSHEGVRIGKHLWRLNPFFAFKKNFLGKTDDDPGLSIGKDETRPPYVLAVGGSSTNKLRLLWILACVVRSLRSNGRRRGNSGFHHGLLLAASVTVMGEFEGSFLKKPGLLSSFLSVRGSARSEHRHSPSSSVRSHAT